MARVNITVPDDLVATAKAQGLNISRIATAALASELETVAARQAGWRYLQEWEQEGQLTSAETAAGRAWWEELTRTATRHGQPPAQANSA